MLCSNIHKLDAIPGRQPLPWAGYARPRIGTTGRRTMT